MKGNEVVKFCFPLMINEEHDFEKGPKYITPVF